jgi:hypothetical protein
MVNYTCLRCGYKTKIKTIFIRHLDRNNTCPLKLNDIDMIHFKKYILEGSHTEDYLKNIQKPNLSINKHNEANNEHIESTESIESTNEYKDNKFKCNYCEKIFKHIPSVNRHKKTCKEKEKDEEVKSSMTELVHIFNKQLEKHDKQLEKRDKQIDEQNKQIQELIKKAGINNSTVNIQNNIKLLNYNKTDTSHLTDNDILKCLNHSNFCIPYLIEKIHFDTEKPENHNVYISNLKNNHVMLYDGNKWKLKDRDEQINNLLDDKQGLIEHKLEEWIEKGKKYPIAMKKFNRYLEKSDNNIVINTIKNEIKLLLYNNRNIVNQEKNRNIVNQEKR